MEVGQRLLDVLSGLLEASGIFWTQLRALYRREMAVVLVGASAEMV